MDFNHNVAQCIKSTSNWGSDTFLNICSGVSHTVNWGSFTWTSTIATFLFLTAISVAAVAMIATPAYVMYKEYVEVYKK